MSAALEAALWPQDAKDDAVAALARLKGWERRRDEPSGRKEAAGPDCETLPVEIAYSDVDTFLSRAAPALLVPEGRDGYLLLLRRSGESVWCLAPDGAPVKLPFERVREALVGGLESGPAEQADRLVERLDLRPARARRARQALLDARLADARLPVGEIVRLKAGAPLWTQAREHGLLRLLLVAVLAQIAAQGVLVASWLTIGDLTLFGVQAWGWIDAWSLLLLSAIPASAIAFWAEQLLTLRLGALLKRRLMHGIVRLDPDRNKRKGAGEFMGIAMEADALELAGLGGGLIAALAVLRLAMAGLLLGFAGADWWIGVLLIIWTGLAAGLAWRVWIVSRDWAASYRALANKLQERMSGHRTYVVQVPRRDWYVQEDAALADYWEKSLPLDGLLAIGAGLLARGWLLIGLAAFALLVWLGGTDPIASGLALLGILIAYQAFAAMGRAVPSLVQLAVAWRELRPLFEAGGSERVPPPGTPPEPDSEAPLFSAEEVSFRYARSGAPLLSQLSFEIAEGDRILLEGASGSGKSTLASLIAGLRTPESGRLSWRGIERRRLGGDWQRRIVNVPQFHENHVFTGTLAYNLLIGSSWPPAPADLDRAEAICRELGLGNLLDEMPQGLQQMVGESGWRLSHGERSRLFIARALLQDPDLVVLDESFAALDPENLKRALDCVLAHARTVLLIAHP